MWGAIRLGDGTIKTCTIPPTLQTIDLLTQDNDLLTLFSDQIVKNKSMFICDGG